MVTLKFNLDSVLRLLSVVPFLSHLSVDKFTLGNEIQFFVTTINYVCIHYDFSFEKIKDSFECFQSSLKTQFWA